MPTGQAFGVSVSGRIRRKTDEYYVSLGGVSVALTLPLGGMTPAPLLIPAVLGKADATFKLVGGSSIVFNVIKSYIFGKPLRCIEYPDGDLATIKVFSMTVTSLRQRIAQAQPPPFPTVILRGDDVKQISVFYAPIFTEPVRTNADVRALPDASWLFWSLVSPQEAIIPRRGVKLESAPPLLPRTSSAPSRWTSPAPSSASSGLSVARSEAEVQDLAVQLVRALYSVGGGSVLGQEEYDRLIDLAVEGDRALLALARNFRDDHSAFSYHAKRLLRRRLGDGRGGLGAAVAELEDRIAQDLSDRKRAHEAASEKQQSPSKEQDTVSALNVRPKRNPDAEASSLSYALER